LVLNVSIAVDATGIVPPIHWWCLSSSINLSARCLEANSNKCEIVKLCTELEHIAYKFSGRVWKRNYVAFKIAVNNKLTIYCKTIFIATVRDQYLTFASFWALLLFICHYR
jgi:hypothetical protein